MYKQAIMNWIAATHSRAVVIADDTDLIETRLINSLDFVGFLLFLEDLSGVEISLDRIRIDRLRTIEAIMTNFFPMEVA